MQEILNKMVASVRHGVLDPDDATRSVHECAALLNLPLATEIPLTTLIITGMRKTVEAENLIEAFSEFGEVSDAAVASNQRGFGECDIRNLLLSCFVPRFFRLTASNSPLTIVLLLLAGILRFKTSRAAERALQRFRTEEIVVQDVAVQVKVLKR
jgi:hypothetical protein